MNVIVTARNHNTGWYREVTLTGRWQLRDYEDKVSLYLERIYPKTRTVPKEVPGRLWGTRTIQTTEKYQATEFIHEEEIRITIEHDIQECN